MEDTIQKKFEKIYSPGIWVKFRKYFIKGLSDSEISILLYGYISHDAITRWTKKLKKIKQKTDN